MVGTQIMIAPELRRNVFLYADRDAAIADDPWAHFCASDMIAIDGIEWPMLEEVRRGLIDRRRPFKKPFHPPDIDPAVTAAMSAILCAADELFADLFPDVTVEERTSSFRPMITGPEPLHFDTFEVVQPVVIAFINLATTPRRYRVGHSFPDLVRDQPDTMREIAKRCNGTNLSYHIRCLTVNDHPPMPKSGPAHSIEFAPGAIWFFCPKTGSHQIVHGRGAIGRSWILPAGCAPLQEDHMETLQ